MAVFWMNDDVIIKRQKVWYHSCFFVFMFKCRNMNKKEGKNTLGDYLTRAKVARCIPPAGRDSGNDFRFPGIASYTCHFCLIFVRISYVVSFRVYINFSRISEIWLKICIPCRINTRTMDIRDPTLKKRNQERTKVVSTISACSCRGQPWMMSDLQKID